MLQLRNLKITAQIMRLIHLAVLFMPLVPALMSSLPPDQQHTLAAATIDRELVPGENPAHYTRVKKDEQLFTIHEFTVSPYPPVV
jgi:hypothetical protein